MNATVVIKPVPVWTVIYQDEDYRCHHIEWGQADGPPLSLELIQKLARKHKKPKYKSNPCLIPSSYAERYGCVNKWTRL